MRRILFTTVVGLEAVLLLGLVLFDSWGAREAQRQRLQTARLAEELLLTDLALWTEARYTRHPSQADWFTPFQNGPSFPDSFPTGIWIPPPQHLLHARQWPGGSP